MLFTDSNYWISLFCDREENRERALELRGEFLMQNLLVNDYAFGEVFTVIAKRYSFELALRACNYLMATSNLEIISAINEELREAAQTSAKFNLSFTDGLIAVQMKKNGVRELVSFDSDFDKIPWVERVS